MNNDGFGREIAARVQYWLSRRRMTREVFAGRLGKSVSWVEKICSGERVLDRLSVLQDIANVLDVSLETLIGQERPRQGHEKAGVDDLRRALQRYDGILGAPKDTQRLDLEQATRQLNYGWQSFVISRYQPICHLLFDILPALHGHATEKNSEQPRAAHQLVRAYQLASEVAFKLDESHLGWLAADRGIQIAEHMGDILLAADTSRRLIHALMCKMESRPEALHLMRYVTARLDSSKLPRSDAYLAVYGSLLLKGSITAARSGLDSHARDLHSFASETADELGEEFTKPWALFGPANVAIHEVSMLVDLHEGGRAVEVARTLPRAQLAKLSTERRARHKLDIAAGLIQTGRRDEAAEELWRADQLGRHEVRGRTLAKKLMGEILHSYPAGLKPPSTITSLARDVTIAA